MNAESDDRARQARHLADLLDMDMDRERSANLIPKKLAQVKDRYDGHIDPEIRIRKAADQLRDYATLIERHATPQTQATHGEGEAVALIDIPAANGLDPITVILRDFAPGHGQITVSCYGQAWTAYWAAMGNRDIRQFLLDCETGYIANRLGPKPRDFDYVSRIVEAIKTHLSVNPSPSPTAAPALGELAERCETYSRKIHELRGMKEQPADDWINSVSLTLSQAASALSGVAAHGETKA